MILSYNKTKLIQELKEYIKYNLSSPSDYIQIYKPNNTEKRSKLIACWHFIDEEINEIKANNNKNIETFIDDFSVSIYPDELVLITIEEYFDSLKI